MTCNVNYMTCECFGTGRAPNRRKRTDIAKDNLNLSNKKRFSRFRCKPLKKTFNILCLMNVTQVNNKSVPSRYFGYKGNVIKHERYSNQIKCYLSHASNRV